MSARAVPATGRLTSGCQRTFVDGGLCMAEIESRDREAAPVVAWQRLPQRQTAKKISQTAARSWRSAGGLGDKAWT